LPQYYPVVHSAFWLEYHAWKLDPLGFHAVNIVLNALNAWLVWKILCLLNVPGALFAAALFAVHPVEVESVAWITERKNVLSTFFFLSALLAYFRFRSIESRTRWSYYARSVGCFICALLSKTVTFSLPFTILLLQWWRNRRLEKRDLLYTAPLFVAGFPFAVQTVILERYQVGAKGDEWAWTFVERVLIAGRALWFYAWSLLWPTNLMFIYPQWEIRADLWWQYLFPAAAVAALGLAWFFRYSISRGPLVALLFFGGTLVPALGFVNFYPMRYTFVADHFQYVASIGLLTACASGLILLVRRLPERWREAGYVACALIVLGLAIQTNRQSRIYESSFSLWNDTLSKNPDCWMAHGNLATILAGQGDLAGATAHLQIAVDHYVDVARKWPRSAAAHRNLGMALLRQAHEREALDHFEMAVSLDPNDFAAQNYLGLLLADQGRSDEAVVHLREALRANPRYALAHFNLANVLFKEGHLEEAETHYRETLTLTPFDDEAHNNLGLLLVRSGQTAEGTREFLKAEELERTMRNQ